MQSFIEIVSGWTARRVKEIYMQLTWSVINLINLYRVSPNRKFRVVFL